MITILICLIILAALFGIAFKLTGALLKACLWVVVCLPIGLVLLCLALICCCTLILIPIGIKLFQAGLHVIIPG